MAGGAPGSPSSYQQHLVASRGAIGPGPLLSGWEAATSLEALLRLGPPRWCLSSSALLPPPLRSGLQMPLPGEVAEGGWSFQELTMPVLAG